jgi:multiple sugar transport system ATP-binding protein
MPLETAAARRGNEGAAARRRGRQLMARVQLNGITKIFRGGTVAVEDLTLDVADGEFVVLVGPSGCGKSTVLRIVAGLEEATAGTVSIDGRVVDDLAPRDRDVAMVFQNYALYPHMTVEENLSFSLRIARVPKAEVHERVADAAHVLSLEQLVARKPAALSGGQRQRVAMGRAIVRRPRVFLMDEPLSNLDAKLRVAMRGELTRLHRRYGVTTLYVTHDQIEAMTLGDRIAVLDHGRLQQVGTPQELYDSPRNVFVAGFIGSPAMNLARGHLVDDPDGVVLVAGDERWPLPPEVFTSRPGLRAYIGRPVVFGLRPHTLGEPQADDRPRLRVRAVAVESLGSERNVLFVPPFGTAAEPEGQNAGDLVADSDASDLWTARLGAATPIRVGDSFELAVDLRHAYFFDVASTEAIAVQPDAALAGTG